jgi:carbon-monoxide dehydrogenase large subunit
VPNPISNTPMDAPGQPCERSAPASEVAELVVHRREDLRLLTGNGQFVADVMLPDMLHVHFVRSVVARGKLIAVECSAARKLPGVAAVFTADDLNRDAGSLRATPMLGTSGPTILPLADSEVRFVGEPIALVIAETPAVATEAAELVVIKVEPRRPVLDPQDAVESADARVFEELHSNIHAEMVFPTRPKLRTALEASPHVVRRTFRQQRLANAPLETRGIVASYRAGKLQAWMSTQNPHEARLAISRATGIAEDCVRVIALDVGGSFGQKFWAGREELTVAIAARRLGRPLKWIETRHENLTASSHGRADIGTCTIALDTQHHFAGWHLDHLEDSGAYPTGVIGGAGPFVGLMFTGPYKVPMHAFRFRSVRTNTSPRGAYRGPWAFATVAREQMIDEAARAIGIDALELRRKNVIRAGDLPYTMATLLSLDRVTPADTLEQAAALIGYDDFRIAQRLAFERQGRLLGVGLALYVEPCSGGSMDPIGSDSVGLRIAQGGSVTATLATGSHGQGVETTMAQLIGAELGVPLTAIRIVQGDTEVAPYGRGTGASGTAVITGGACRAACAALREKGRRIAAHLLNISSDEVVFRDGKFRDPASAHEFTWADVALVACRETDRLPPGEPIELEAIGSYRAPPATWSNGCHACTLEIDPATGGVTLLHYVASEDCGVMINRMIVAGQIAGGIAQGIGAALEEGVVYDSMAVPLTRSFLEYPIPRAADLPPIELGHIETASDSPGGHKGVGQGGAVVSPACVFNAVADALALVHVKAPQMPLTSQAIFTAFRSASPPAQ